YDLVTGVQTCALPISHHPVRGAVPLESGEPAVWLRGGTGSTRPLSIHQPNRVSGLHDFGIRPTGGQLVPTRRAALGRAADPPIRSEERRVGKEWRGQA